MHATTFKTLWIMWVRCSFATLISSWKQCVRTAYDQWLAGIFHWLWSYILLCRMYITSSVTLAEFCFPSLPTEQKSEPKQYIEWTKMQYSVQNARKQQKKTYPWNSHSQTANFSFLNLHWISRHRPIKCCALELPLILLRVSRVHALEITWPIWPYDPCDHERGSAQIITCMGYIHCAWENRDYLAGKLVGWSG